MSYVLDTNILVAALNGDANVVRRLNEVPTKDEAILAAMVLGELRYGALSSSRVEANLARIDQLIQAMTFAVVDRAVVERFASVKVALRQRGIAKSDADLLIAATALERAATLVTNDHALLDGSIPDLRAENWIAAVSP